MRATDLHILVAGAGLMGRGIARLFADAGATVRLLDATPELTAAALATLWDEGPPVEGPGSIVAAELDAASLAEVQLAIEAVAEDAAIKGGLLQQLYAALPPTAIVATNTSSLSVATLARAVEDPSRFLGLHFFNPPTRMRLVEVVSGPGTSADTVAFAEACVEAVQRTPVRCADAPGFIVNRVCRPLYGESQLLVAQGLAPATVDTVVRQALGHPLGPLALLDRIGLAVHEASCDNAHAEFGEPRYAPTSLLRQLVRAGRTGRGAGSGYYDYAVLPPRDAAAGVLQPPPATGDDGPPVVAAGPGAPRLARRCGLALHGEAGELPAGTVVLWSCPDGATDADVAGVAALATAGHTIAIDSSDGRWLRDRPDTAAWLRLHLTGAEPFAEVVDDDEAQIHPGDAARAVLAATGARSVRVPAVPGLVADRLRAVLVNEACLVVEQGLAEPAAVDLALRLGMNHPDGPFELLEARGAATVTADLTSLQRDTGDPRYRPATLLRRRAASSR